MSDNTSNNKRIYKNTAVLYVRMIVVMIISLYTSRIVLKALGVDDFGLYNVVGGVVGLLTFFNTTMTKTTQRFLNVAMVEGKDSLSNIFSSSLTVHILFALIFLLIAETVGLLFLNTRINIPEGREVAANIVYQATIFSCCTSIVMIPYNSVVIAYEKMSYIAIVSIIDAVLKLGIALSLLSWSSDRLSLYGALIPSVAILNFIMYFAYCKRKHPSLRFRLSYNKKIFKKIFSFVSWTLLGQFAIVGCNQGNVVLVNMFHALTANAAMSVGSQINHAITNLTSNFQTAFTPQITKSYAEKNYDYLKSLVYSTSKVSFFILFIVALPIAFNINWILELWLDKVPPLSNVFAILFMLNGIMNALSSPFNFTVLSSERIRNYQIVVSVIFVMDLPIVYLLFSIGFPPTTVLCVKVFVMAAAMFARIYFASKVVPTINSISYIREVLLQLTIAATISVFLAFILDRMVGLPIERLLFTIIIELCSFTLIWKLCLNKSERQVVIRIMNRVPGLKNISNKKNGVL